MKGKIETSTLKEIGEVLIGAQSVLIFPHISIDGDALGSAVALCLGLRKMGKQAFVLMEDELPSYLQFLKGDCCIWDASVISNPDLAVCVDTNSPEMRFPKGAATFRAAKETVCIDHHLTSKPFANYNYIDPTKAATAEIIYHLFKAMEWPIDRDIARAIYVGVVTDTGNFQYSNTTAESHYIAAEMIGLGVSPVEVNNALYQSNSLARIRLTGRILSDIDIFANGSVAMGTVTQKMLKEEEAVMSDAEGISESLRSIEGVEIGVFLKEEELSEDGGSVVKVSMRAKSFANVAAFCQKFGGGGHIRAAGCTLNLPIKKAAKLMKKELEAYLATLQEI